MTPKSSRSCRTPTSMCFTPRTPSTAAAQLLSINTASRGQEEVVEKKGSIVTIATPAVPECVGGYPRLLGRAPATSAAAVAGQRRVRFNEARELAGGARAACLAMQQRIAGRADVVEEKNGIVSIVSMPAPESGEAYPRLLGRAPATSAAAVVAGQRRVRFNEAQELAEGAQATCLTMQQRIAGRRLPKRAYHY